MNPFIDFLRLCAVTFTAAATFSLTWFLGFFPLQCSFFYSSTKFDILLIPYAYEHTFKKYRIFFVYLHLLYNEIWDGVAKLNILITRIRIAHRVVCSCTYYCVKKSNSLKTVPQKTYPDLMRLKHSAVAFYAMLYSWISSIIQDIFPNRYVILAEFLGIRIISNFAHELKLY
jgi:hypothetical protein